VAQHGCRVFVITAVINIGTLLVLPMGWIAAHSLLPGYKLGVVGGDAPLETRGQAITQ
jgi:hypothetical protein